MRIALVHPTLEVRGGAENIVVWLALGLKQRGHEVTVFTAGYAPGLWKEGGASAIQVEVLRDRLAFLNSTRLTLLCLGRALRRRLADFDVVNSHNWPSNLWVARARRGTHRFPRVVWYCQEPSRRIHWEKTDKNLVSFVAGPSDPRYNAHLRDDVERERRSASRSPQRVRKRARDIAWDRAAAAAADTVLVNSRFSKANFEDVYGRAATVCYLGIPQSRLGEPCSAKQPYFCAVSALTRKKNIHNVIEAMDILVNQRGLKDIHLKIAGDGSDRGIMENMAAQHGLAGCVEFLGFVPDDELIRVYQGARLLVYVPVDEPFGLVPLEAMACGTPVIASDHGGPLETVVHGQTGLHVSPFDPVAIAEGIRSLYYDEGTRRAMGENGARRVREQFTIESFLDRFERLAFAGDGGRPGGA